MMTTRNRRWIGLALLLCTICYFQARRLRWLGDLGFAMDVIHFLYYSEIDRKDLYRAAMTGMTEKLDRYSGYFEAEDYDAFQKVLEQEFGGIGILIDGPPRYDKIVIVTPLYDTPAYRAGLEPGDHILEVDGTSLEGLSIEEASKLMKGGEGTQVRLKIGRVGQETPLDFALTREAIELESVVGDRRQEDTRWSYRLETHPEIGYLRITSFGSKTGSEMKEAMEKVQKQGDVPLRGLILDLRDNPGGLLSAATEICDMFMDDGVIVSTKGRMGRFENSVSANPGKLLPDTIPMVVLVNDQSASASEVVSACLQDIGRAKVAGERSYGKGSVQNLIELDGGRAALKLTTARYFPPSGRNIDRGDAKDEKSEWGVSPAPELVKELDEEEHRKVFQRWRERGGKAEEAESWADLQALDPQLAIAIEALTSSRMGLQTLDDSQQ